MPKKTKKKVIHNVKKTVDKKKAPRKKTGPKKRDPMVSFMPKLERFLILGYSLSKACMLSGLPDSSVGDYYRADAKFRLAVDSLMHAPNVKARANWVSEVQKGNYNASRDWLAAREKEDFSTRTENTGKDGEPLTQPIEVVFVRKEKE